MTISTTPVRSNLYLWLLTGRSNDFFNEALNTGVIYSVSSTPDEVRGARALLRLSETTTDFYVLAALAAAKMSTAIVRTLPHEHDAVFVNGFLALPSISTSRPMLPSSSASWPSIDGGRAGKEGFTTLTVKSLGGGFAELRTDAGAVERSACVAAPTGDGDYRLSVTQLPVFGVNAHFRVPSWETGDAVSVQFSPTRYPFADVADAIRGSSFARRLMNAEGTMQAFAETSNSALKVGMLGLAIIRRMLRHANDEQAGFSATVTIEGEPPQRLYSVDQVFSASLYAEPVTADNPVGFDV